MSENIFISFIVPVYNVELYLSDCVNSILNQSYQFFELLLIDDGSTDNSGAICDELVLKDSRIKVRHIANSGVSTARNLGVDLAAGEIIIFVDSDDTIESNFLELHLNYTKYDLVVSGLANVYGNRTKYNSISSNISYEKHSIVDGLIIGLDLNIINSPVAKLFKRDIIKRNNISFNSNISYGEDHLFVVEYARNCSNMAFLSECCYNYFHRNNCSLTNRVIPPLELIHYAELVVSAMKLIDSRSKHMLYLDRFLIKNYTLACCTLLKNNGSDELFGEIKSKIFKSRIINTNSTLFISLCTLLLYLPDKLCRFLLPFLLELKSNLKAKL